LHAIPRVSLRERRWPRPGCTHRTIVRSCRGAPVGPPCRLTSSPTTYPDRVTPQPADLSPPWPPTFEDVTAARDADREAMGRVLGAGHPRLIAFYHGGGMPYDLVGEIVAGALEGMVRNFPRLREPLAFEAWFWTIARNRMRTALRRRRAQQDGRDAFVSPSTPEEKVIIGLEHDLIRRALDRKSTRLNSSHVKISYAVFC